MNRPSKTAAALAANLVGAAAALGIGGSASAPVSLGIRPMVSTGFDLVSAAKGGAFTAQVPLDANGAFRAVTGKDASNEVRVQKRANVRLEPTRFGKYRVSVVAKLSFWRKPVAIERYDPKRRAWAPVKTALLQDSDGAGVYVWSVSQPFALALPTGRSIRTTLAAKQSKPCYLAGYSKPIRT